MIRKALTITLLLAIPAGVYAQTLSAAFKYDWERFNRDPQLKHATISICILNGKTGRLLFSQNKDLGLAPASCNKTLTAAAAFHYLGEHFRYATPLQYSGTITNGILHGNIIIRGCGDPTLGSWRYPGNDTTTILHQWVNVIRDAGIREIDGSVIGDDTAFGTQIMPDGWMWEDMGNYYGAGGGALNWHENQFDLLLQPGAKVGDSASLVKIYGAPPEVVFINELTTAPAGSGDEAYVYLAPYGHIAYLRGTVPLDADRNFSISGAVPDPGDYCAAQLTQELESSGIAVQNGYTTARILLTKHLTVPPGTQTLLIHYSPDLDSITYWFLKRSINLYGELLAKKIAQQEGAPATTANGVALIHRFCAENGMDTTAINTIDGSGLSPADRVTTYALAKMLYLDQYQSWFHAYYYALPIIHDIHMKDGYISGVRSFTGFTRTRQGTPLVFSFIVNDFTGSAGTIRDKMWHVLDMLKR